MKRTLDLPALRKLSHSLAGEKGQREREREREREGEALGL